MPQRIRTARTKPGSEPVHVDIIERDYKGTLHKYTLLRQSFREEGKVKHRTLANISFLPDPTIELIRASLKGTAFVPRDEFFRIERSHPHGHVAAVLGSMSKLGLERLLDPLPSTERALAMAMIASQVIRPSSKLASLTTLQDTSLLIELGITTSVDHGDLYETMDWLHQRKEAIERRLCQRHLQPGDLALYDRSSADYPGRQSELTARGYSRDHNRSALQVTFGLICDRDGRPLRISLGAGSVSDPETVNQEIEILMQDYGLSEVVLVGDRGLLTKARTAELKKLPNVGWITALRAPAIRKLVEKGSIQLGLFDLRNLAEITSPDYPDERVVVCYNPTVAQDGACTRQELLEATEKELARVTAMVQSGRLKATAKIALRAGKVCNRFKLAKHFEFEIDEGKFSYRRQEAAIKAEAAMDGLYAIRTSVGAKRMPAEEVVRSYKSLSRVERDFRVIKGPDLEVVPSGHHLSERIEAHFQIKHLAAYVRWHMERDLAPLIFRDENPPVLENPVLPTERSEGAQRKARNKHDVEGAPVRGLRTLLSHMGTLCKNVVALAGTGVRYYQLTEPTPIQRRALELLGVRLDVARKSAPASR